MRKFLILVFPVIYSLSTLLSAQNNTFERSYPGSYGYLSTVLKNIELTDGNYLIIGSKNQYYDNSSWKNCILTKIDKNGFTIWRNEIETVVTRFRPSNQVLITDDNKILVLSIKNIDSLSTLNLSKFDFSGNEIFSLNLKSDSSLNGCAIRAIDEGGYLIVTGDDLLTNQNISIIKLDIHLNILWEKVFFLEPRTILGESFSINKWGIDSYAIGARRNILNIDLSGNKLTQIDCYHRFIAETAERNILVSEEKSLSLINPNGLIINTFTFEDYLGPVIQTEDGNLLISLYSKDFNAPNSIRKMDLSGNTLWSTNIYGKTFCITELSDHFLLGSGRYNDNLWAYKTNSFGNYTAINILSPIGREKLFTFNTYDINWYSNGVEKVSLSYSSNDGNTWQLIKSNLDADSGKFIWTVPLVLTDKIKLKIQDSNNPNILNLTEYPIFISIYQPLDYISTNEILMWIGNNGMGSYDPHKNYSGFYWPISDSTIHTAIFADGLVWGGKVNGEIRVNGNTYRNGLQPGRILEDGTADNPLYTQNKIFKIRKDWQTLPESVFKDRLEYDYNHWPVEAGAPWDDINEDGVYTPGFDKPIFIGDETLFYVANDLDTAISKFTYGSDPIGLEFQTTVFGFNREDLKDVVFKKYRVINKSNTDITDMYFSYWADVDLGFPNDDYEGFDSSYNMSYIFNADNYDDYSYGTPPPAIGHMIVQGPIIPAAITDSARYDTGWKYGYKNLRMSSSGMIMKWGIDWPMDPDLGVYNGTIQFYNMMQGLNVDGSQLINPLTGEPTIWPLTGDPVTGTGWYEGDGWPGGDYPGDHRYHVPSGPFNLAAGDTQEIVIAIPIARGTDNINSITKLRELAAHVQEFYNTELVDILNTKETVTPNGFTLYQNYPNPFNPNTTIEYEVPEKSFVTIKIYDILGREVQTLVNNEEKVRWKYKIVFDASILASGVYFYRIQAGNFTETKKMMVLK